MRQTAESNGTNNSTAATTIVYKRIPYSRLLSAESSDELRTYSVTVRGKNDEKEVEIVSSHDERHPLMAAGRAAVQYLKRFVLGTITHVEVSERVEKSKSNTK